MAESKTTIITIKKQIVKEGFKVPLGLRKRELELFLVGIRKAKTLPKPLHATSADYTTLIPKYVDTNMHWKEHLIRFGWTTVPIPNCNSSKYVDCIFSYLESCSPVSLEAIKTAGSNAKNYPRLSQPMFNRNDMKTWTTNNMPSNLHGIMKHYSGHSNWQWELRELCYPIYREVYNDNELLSSYDGWCFLKPLEVSSSGVIKPTIATNNTNNSKKEPAVTGYKQWLHLDQDRLSELTDGFSPNTMSCVQGLVNMLDSTEVDGGLVVVEKSHECFGRYLERHPADGFGWFKVDMSDPELSKLPIVKVCAPAGHLILWDSRVVHANCPPRGQLKLKPRICAYVSMQPKKHATKKELEKRIRLYEEGRETNHNVAGHLFKETSKHPMTYGAPVVMPREPFCSPKLSELGRRLVGYSI